MAEQTKKVFNWVPDIKNWERIDKDAAATMLALAEKRLSESLVLAENLKKKTDLLRTITVPVFSLSAGYFAKNIFGERDKWDSPLMWIALLVALPLIFALYYLGKNIFANFDPALPGSPPIKTLTAERYDGDKQGPKQYLDLVMFQLTVYQNSIDENIEENKRTVENIRNAELALLVGTVILIFSTPAFFSIWR